MSTCGRTFDVCVIGAGVNGSSAAYQLVKRKKNVLLLEQYPALHSLGSSHGHSRIFRCENEDFSYVKASHDSIAFWKQLEKETGEALLIQTGALNLYHPTLNQVEIQNCCRHLDTLGVKYDILNAAEINKRFSLFNLPPDIRGMYEHGGGFLVASKCVAAFQSMFKQMNGTFKDCEKVIDITVDRDVTIKTMKATYHAKSVIIAAGAYTNYLARKMGLDLPLKYREHSFLTFWNDKVIRTFPCYWKLKDPSVGTAESHFPSFKSIFSEYLCYGTASYEYPGLIKICVHKGVETDTENLHVPSDITDVVKYIQTYMKNVETKPNIVEECLYTMTPDERFIIDKHPLYSNVVIATGFSGQGFKMAPATGKMLADLALDDYSGHDISGFSLTRFPNVLKVKAAL